VPKFRNIEEFQKTLSERFAISSTDVDYEKAFAYVDKVVDREIGKAVGLLTFNSIIIAIAVWGELWLPILASAIASVVLLVLLWVVKGSPEDIQTAQHDFQMTSAMIWQRMVWINVAGAFYRDRRTSRARSGAAPLPFVKVSRTLASRRKLREPGPERCRNQHIYIARIASEKRSFLRRIAEPEKMLAKMG
jgi:hypothetical protein